MKLLSFITLIIIGISTNSFGQNPGWHMLEPVKDGPVGISATKVYSNLLKGKSSTPVVVAVIDSGVDVEHEDLKDVVWVNTDEIPDNNIDDDNNGYIDDVNGWNFIGGPDGNVDYDTYEVTRLYGKYKYKFEDANVNKLSKSDKELYDQWLTWKEKVETERSRGETSLQRITEFEERIKTGLDAVGKELDGKAPSLENLQAIESSDDKVVMGKDILLDQITRGQEVTNLDDFKQLVINDMKGQKDYYTGVAKYAYNPDFNPRTVIGDNYADQTERYYGNNDVEGPDARHGTHVAGIIGATRNNEIGMDGVADNVRIMSVRTVPNGDERDKDVANAIRYAVDNGASIINMSFGKGYSWNEKVVEDAIKYAEKKDVLLVHAAGNSGQNNDTTDNFPNDMYKGKGFLFFKGKTKNYKNWLEIGALNYQNGENLSAPFSNYGAENVDLFAPGMAIYSTIPDDGYEPLQGTSMAAPVVAGVAALLRSYYPSLTAVQVKNILMGSSTKLSQKVIIPGTADEKTSFSNLSVSGGTVNAEKAIKLAEITKGKKKVKTSLNRA
jgi:subtilisin family serine protease